MDNKDLKGGQDRIRIEASEDYELQYWSEKFHVTREEIREAVKEVGSQSEDVERYLADNS